MNDKLKKTIDRMVEDSIRRILPAVMNEVLLKTIANANVIQETRRAEPFQQKRQELNQKIVQRKPASLSHLLDPEAGADFYQDPRAAMAEATREEPAPAPRGQVIAERIQNLPPDLRSLAEDVDLDDAGEMWDSDVGDSFVPSAGMGPPLERAAQAAGLDFSRMRKAINLTEKKGPKGDVADRMANAQFEAQRIKMMRDRLDAK